MSEITVKVRIFDHDYQISCEEGERKALVEAADLVDQRMRAIREAGMIGVERIAVMAALDLADDLVKADAGGVGSDDLARLTKKLQTALAK